MRLRILFVFLFIVCFCSGVYGQTYVKSHKLALAIPTTINYDLADWDTVFAVITDSVGVLVDTIGLSHADSGRWRGSYSLTALLGSYVVEYYAVYGNDTTPEFVSISVIDTVAFHGAAAGLTAQEIIDLMGAQGWFFGLGVFACTVTTKLDLDSSVLSGVHVIVKSADQSAPLCHAYTDANGQAILGLDSMNTGYTHKFWIMDVDYDFDFPDSARVTSDTGLTFYGAAFDYGDPPADSQCAVNDQIFNPLLDSLNGVIVSAKVYVPQDSILRYRGYIISPFKVVDTTGVTGRWRLDLIPNAKFDPDNTKYIFSFAYPVSWGGYIVREDTVTVPEQESATYDEIKGW